MSSSSSTPIHTNAMMPQRSLLFFTLTATCPIIVLVFVLLVTRSKLLTLQLLSVIGGGVSLIGFGKLLYDLTLDLAGFPEYHLPVWAVLYLVMYLVFGFTFVFFGLHIRNPGVMFGGFICCDKRVAFIDALYISMCVFAGIAPSGNIIYRTQTARFLTLIEAIIGMFVSGVILTKFVSSYLK